MGMVTLSWIIHTGYLLQEPQQIITNPNLTEATTPDQVQGTTVKTGIGKVIPDHNLIFTDRGCSMSQHQDNGSHPRRSSQHSHFTYRDYSHWSHCDTPHWPHHRSSTHKSSSAYHSRGCGRSCSQPCYKSSRWDLHQSHSHSSRSWGKSHLKKNLKVKIKDPHMDYYSSDEYSSDSGEEANHLK